MGPQSIHPHPPPLKNALWPEMRVGGGGVISPWKIEQWQANTKQALNVEGTTSAGVAENEKESSEIAQGTSVPQNQRNHEEVAVNTKDASWDWILKIESGLKAIPVAPWSATLTTGMDGAGAPMLDFSEATWKQGVNSGSIEKYQQFLIERGSPLSENQLEATASEHGFVPETAGISNAEMEQRLTSSLPHLAYMISTTRQAANLEENMLAKCDAAPRPYWLRDRQTDFGGFTKVYGAGSHRH